MSGAPTPGIQVFQWAPNARDALKTLEAAPALDLASTVHDMAAGMLTVLQLLELDALNADDPGPGDSPPLGVLHRSRLQRLTIACATAMKDAADRYLERADDLALDKR